MSKRNLALVASLFLVLAIPSFWPYGYYMLMRVVVCGISLYLAYYSKQAGKQQWMVIMALIALLFNPFLPVHLTKEIWSVIDFITALTFLRFRAQEN